VAGGSDIVSAQELADIWRRVDGCPGDPVAQVLPGTDGIVATQSTSAVCTAGTSVVSIRVDGGGHTWPNAPTFLSEDTVGPTTHAFDASETSWRFFDAHGR
jgi:polyhydroxybutyrate depolymerase